MTNFYLPLAGNQITRKDIENGIIRITVDAKPYFLNCDTIVSIITKKETHRVSYTKRAGRSDVLYLGKELIKSISLKPGNRIRFTKVSDEEFVIENGTFLFSDVETTDINYHSLVSLKAKYWQALKEFRFPDPPKSGGAIDMIKYFKRRVNDAIHTIGPYTGLTVFEAANRIASDLVIINGILNLIESGQEKRDSVFTIRLGNLHENGKGDFTINGKEGEAFNVASSFYQGKMRLTKKKWKDGGLDYILVNGDVFSENFESNDLRIIKVHNWDQE